MSAAAHFTVALSIPTGSTLPGANFFDLALMVLIGVLLPLLDLWLYPHFERAASRPGAARIRFYLAGIAIQWGAVAGVVGNWIISGRSLTGLGLGAPSAIRMTIGVALAAAYLWLVRTQYRTILRRADARDLIRRMLGRGAAMIPRTAAEFRVFIALSLTAGICEEALYRGMVNFWFSEWGGPVAGLVVSSIAFGFAHLYLGRKDFVRTTVTGVILWLIAFASGSLLPVMVIHAAMDLVAGDLGYRALGERVGSVAAREPDGGSESIHAAGRSTIDHE